MFYRNRIRNKGDAAVLFLLEQSGFVKMTRCTVMAPAGERCYLYVPIAADYDHWSWYIINDHPAPQHTPSSSCGRLWPAGPPQTPSSVHSRCPETIYLDKNKTSKQNTEVNRKSEQEISQWKTAEKKKLTSCMEETSKGELQVGGQAAGREKWNKTSSYGARLVSKIFTKCTRFVSEHNSQICYTIQHKFTVSNSTSRNK